MRIIFMGTPDFAIPSLRNLLERNFEVVGVVTSPDRPAGRGQKLRPSPVKSFAESKGLKVLQPKKLSDPAFVAKLQALAPDLMVVVAFRMLPEIIWSIPEQGTFNLHAALLPDYRGAAPLNWVLINGETQTGATTFFIDHKIDTGSILLQRKLEIPDDWNVGDLHDAMMELGADLVLETVQAIEQGKVHPQPQDHSAFQNPAPKLFKENCKIDWGKSAFEIHNLVRGLSPYPTAWTELNGLNLKVFATRLADDKGDGIPGKVTLLQHQLFVSTSKGSLEITELQLAGKKRMDTATFLRGYQKEITHVG